MWCGSGSRRGKISLMVVTLCRHWIKVKGGTSQTSSGRSRLRCSLRVPDYATGIGLYTMDLRWRSARVIPGVKGKSLSDEILSHYDMHWSYARRLAVAPVASSRPRSQWGTKPAPARDEKRMGLGVSLLSTGTQVSAGE